MRGDVYLLVRGSSLMKISMLSALCVWGKSTRFAGSRASASTAISSRSRCFAFVSPSLKARGDRVSIWLRHVRRIHPFLSRSRRIMKPSRPFLKRASAFLLNGRRDFIFCFWGGGKCHLSALLSWWKSLWGVTRSSYSGSRSITSRLAAGARDLQMLKVRRQISVGWPGGGASATVSPLLWWSPWRGNSFMEQTVFVPCFCAIDVDLLDYRWCKARGLYDDAPDWRDARELSLSWEFIIIKESNSPHQAMQSNIFTGGESLSSRGQAGAALHTMAVLQAYQADLLKDLSTGGVNWRRGIFRTSPATDLSLRATKQTAVPSAVLWLPWFPRRDICGSTSRASRTRTALSSLMPHLAFRRPLFGDAVNTVATRFREAKRYEEAFVRFLPRRAQESGTSATRVPTRTGSFEAWSTKGECGEPSTPS